MRLSDVEIIPGTVLAVCNNYGVIKASCIGVFSEDADIDKLPPVYPAPTSTSNTTFCEPQIGDLIWVWINKNNPLELFYTFQCDALTGNGSVLDAGYDACHIIHKDNDNGSSLQWNDQEGWKMDTQQSKFQIEPSGDILLSQDNAHQIKMSNNGIQLTADGGGEENPAVLGNELKKTIQAIINTLQATAQAGKANSETMAMAVALEGGLIKIQQCLTKILSSNISIN